MSEFDYQWTHLPSPLLDYAPVRVLEFLNYVQLPRDWFREKQCLDAGCGNGRWTWAMMQLGANVVSIDASKEAVRLCRNINPDGTFLYDLSFFYDSADLVFSWGVLHHLKDPKLGFMHLAHNCVKPGGYLHIMVYHADIQKFYYPLRKIWKLLPGTKFKHGFAWLLSKQFGGTTHSWWDALNPKYNHSFYPREIYQWFEEANYGNIIMTKEFNINMRGRRQDV